MLRKLIVLALLISVTPPASAYLDPGSGSMLLYALAGIGAAFAYSIRSFFYRLTHFFTGRGSQPVSDIESTDLVFYSEGGHYWQVFAPVIDALTRMNVKTAYLTSDENDKGLQYDSPLMVARYIGNSAMSTAVLNQLTASVLVMTLPQLGIFTLKRSQNVHHYSHIIHAPTDALIYKRYAFDHFDSVLCSGAHQIKTIRELENKRGTPRKELFETGITYYDAMLDNLSDIVESGNKKTILVAPTWGKHGLLSRYGSDWLELLLNHDYKVILRPHPQSYQSEKELMKKIEGDLRHFGDLKIDRSPSGLASMAHSDILISDLSGIIFDFAFIFSRPVIIVDADVERGGFEAEYLEKEIWEVSVRGEVGKLVTDQDFPILPTIVKQTLSSFSPTNLERFRDQSLFNFGTAGEVAASQLVEILNKQTSDFATVSEKLN